MASTARLGLFRAFQCPASLGPGPTSRLFTRKTKLGARCNNSSTLNLLPRGSQRRWNSNETDRPATADKAPSTSGSDSATTTSASTGKANRELAGGRYNLYGSDWEDTVDKRIQSFKDLPHEKFGINQHMIINLDLKEAFRVMLRQFNAPIVYCFAYGSGVFPQDNTGRSISEAEFRAVHPQPPAPLVKSQKGSPKMVDFIFGVSHTEHWHSINMKQHRNHYSSVASLGSGAVSHVQEWGAGVYFNPFVEVNGMLIKYGVTSIDNLVDDLSTWDNLYLAGRLQKPVKILRDNPRVRLANQHNLLSAVRTALLLLPPDFKESDLYSTIAGLSYLGDPRMSLPTEDKGKVANIVDHNMVHFRRLYAPLVKSLPNVEFADERRLDDESWVLNPNANADMHQIMDSTMRSNMVRRLPKHFRERLYFQYQKKFSIPRGEFNRMMEEAADDETSIKRRQGGKFEKRVAADPPEELNRIVRQVIKQTVKWPSTIQSIKGLLMGGWSRTLRYLGEKFAKWRKGRRKDAKPAEVEDKPDQKLAEKKKPE